MKRGRKPRIVCFIPTHLKCTTCRRVLPVDSFYKCPSRTYNGYSNTCKICNKIISANRLTRRNAQKKTVEELDADIARLQEIIDIKQQVLGEKIKDSSHE